MRYQFLVDTYASEITKTLSVWGMFRDADLAARPHPSDPRGRNLLGHMVHQCISEDLWFKRMFGIAVVENPLPSAETRAGFIAAYADAAAQRLAALNTKPEAWWEEETAFFDVPRSRLWIMTRRLNHSAHHRGQQTTLLRMLSQPLHSTYGPTADTGGLMVNQAPTIYAWPDQAAIVRGDDKAPLPGPGVKPCTERP